MKQQSLTDEQLQQQRLKCWKGQFEKLNDEVWLRAKSKIAQAKIFQVRGGLLNKIRQLEPEYGK
jgi:hypothetical protein